MYNCLLLILIFSNIQGIFSLSIENVYTRYINREKIDQSDTFGFHVPRPLGYKGNEPIWPRSYGYSAEMFFDENGVGFPLHKKPNIGQILGNIHKPQYQEDRDEENEERVLIKKFLKRVSRRRTSI